MYFPLKPPHLVFFYSATLFFYVAIWLLPYSGTNGRKTVFLQLWNQPPWTEGNNTISST